MTESLNHVKLIEIAIDAAVKAGVKIMEIYEDDDFDTQLKSDDSPLTKADVAANTIINSVLNTTGIPIISEENKQIPYEERSDWKHCWLVDPLDGTKEFIKRNGEFTVNIALLNQGEPVLGVIYVPVSKALYYASTSSNTAFKITLDENHGVNGPLFDNVNSISGSEPNNESIRVVGSRSHMNEETSTYVNALKANYKDVEIVSKGSSLKFCLVAEGKADVYPRFAPTMEWDTAAGHAICNAVGLKVTAQDTNAPLLYNKENLLNPYFLVSR